MRVAFVPKAGFELPSSRYRCFYFAEALDKAGVATRIIEPFYQRGRPRHSLGEPMRMARALRSLTADEILYLQRPTHDGLFVAMVALMRRLRPSTKIVFDFCDPIWIHSPSKTRLLTKLADLVIVSCEDLAVWARQYNDAVEVIPNSVPALPSPKQSRDELPLVLGWQGNALGHRENLRFLGSVLADFDYPLRLRLVGTRNAGSILEEFESTAKISAETVDWIAPEEVAGEMAGWDIALLPVQDTPWNGKLLTKLVEYMASGLPIVASPVGANRHAIRDGENGFLAKDIGEWRAKLARLLESASLRRTLGARARATVERDFCLESNGPRLAAALRRLAQHG